MPIPSPGYAITVRVEAPAAINTTGLLAATVHEAGGALTALDVVESRAHTIVVDVTCNTSDETHANAITDALGKMPEVTVRKVSDRTFLLHIGGKVEVKSKLPIRNRDDLSRAYTPGVARVCMAIAENPEDARRLTIKRNTVAVVTDGTAVLGLGDIGPSAAMPVMEGKAILFKQFADVDAWPVALDTKDADEIVRIVKALAPAYGGINLEDISAPRCFEIEERLRNELDIPVFHDDQHGTAIVVLAALTNALRVVDKKIEDVRITVAGVGAAGSAIIKLLLAEGAQDIVGVDHHGILTPGGPPVNPFRDWVAENTNPRGVTGTLAEALKGADVFIGVAAPNLFGAAELATMAQDSIIFTLANPDPEVDPTVASEYATIVATGRSDYPNQINNVLAFPGLFRGLLDAGASDITQDMMTAAAEAIANCVAPEELNPTYIIPSVFNTHVAWAVADAVKEVAQREKAEMPAK